MSVLKNIFISVICLFSFLNLQAQSRKEINELLQFKVDSLTLINDKLKFDYQNSLNKIEKNNSIYQDELKRLSEQNNKLRITNQTSLNRIYDSLKIDSQTWIFDTIKGEENHVCYFIEYRYPYILKSPFNEDTRSNLNELIQNRCKEIPDLLSNIQYDQFRNCEKGRYVFSEELVKGHIIHSGEDFCSWCASQFYSSIEGIYIGEKYASILFHFSYETGGNWSHSGYSSLNIDLKTGKEIKFNFNTTNTTEKNDFIQDIIEIISSESYIDFVAPSYHQDYTGQCNSVVNELKQKSLNNFCFYFKNDELHLIVMNGGHGPEEECLFNSKVLKFQNRLGY